MLAPTPRAWGYLRVSDGSQLTGDGIDRQQRLIEAACANHGWLLAGTFTDQGISGYNSVNAEIGTLRDIRRKVETGAIGAGELVVVENLDRLGRDGRRTKRLLEDICDFGVAVHTVFDGQTYTAASLDELAHDVLASVNSYGAKDYSRKLERRLLEKWSARRAAAGEQATMKGIRPPAWLRWSAAEQRFELIEDRAATVRKVWDMALAGHGKEHIAKRLNDEGIPCFATNRRSTAGWYASYIDKLLRSPAAYGAYQPMTARRVVINGRKQVIREPAGPLLRNQFPAVVTEAEFLAVQGSRQQRRAVTDTNARPLANLFRGLLRCSHCGATLQFLNKGAAKSASYLRCNNSLRIVKDNQGNRICTAPPLRYGDVLETVYSFLLERAADLWLDLDQLPTRDLAAEITAAKAAVSDLEAQLDEQLSLRVTSPAVKARIEAKADQLGSRLEQQQLLLAQLEQEQRTAPADPIAALQDAASVCVRALLYHLPGTAGEPAGEQLSEADTAVLFNQSAHRLFRYIEADRQQLTLHRHQGEPLSLALKPLS